MLSRKARRICLSVVVTLATGLGLSVPSLAAAAPELQLSLDQSPATVNRGDRYVTFTVAVDNIGDTATTTATNVALNLPAGMSLNEGTGTGWACYLTPRTCTSNQLVAGGGSFPPLEVAVNLEPAQLAPTPVLTVTAFGGGASSPSIGQRELELGPWLEFGVIPGSFEARAIDEVDADFTQAGGHPFAATTSFDLVKEARKPFSSTGGLFTEGPFEHLRDGAVSLPPGFVANPTALADGCEIGQVRIGTCPERYAVGLAYADLGSTTARRDQRAVVFKIKVEKGYPAAFAFRPVNVSGATVVVRPRVRPQDFTVVAEIPRPVQNPELFQLHYFTLCSYGAKVVAGDANSWFSPGCKSATDAGSLATPLVTNPTRCDGERDLISIDVASYENRGRFDDEGFPDLSDPNWKSTSTTAPDPTDCELLPFDPSFSAQPTTGVADSPTGLDFDLHIPQEGLVDADGLGSAHLKDTTVLLPEGMVVNPAAGDGLEACSTGQMGLLGTDFPEPYAIRFNGKPVTCPPASKVGTVTIESPLVDETVEGAVYLGEPYKNPFGSLLSLYIAVRNDDIGFSAKLAGKVMPDASTGRLTAVFAENPQLPFQDLKLKFFDGPRASLSTPATCGTSTTEATFSSWSDQTAVAERVNSFETASAQGGKACVTDAAQLAPPSEIAAGTADNTAGVNSSFSLSITRGPGTQELKRITDVALPEGLTGRVAAVELCDDQLADRGECPASSRVGRIEVAAGSGTKPLWVPQAGKDPTAVYLTGSYRDAPYGLSIVVPAQAGPFDLGTVVVRSALHVDERTAAITSGVDEVRMFGTDGTLKNDLGADLPRILEGIVLNQRQIRVIIDRPGFMINPTDCSAKQVTARLAGYQGGLAAAGSGFQVRDCAKLGFKPKFRARILDKGRRSTGRSWHPRTRFSVVPRPGDANIGGARVALPSSTILDQGNIGTTCTRAQMAARDCPAKSVVGYARAWSPLLRRAVEGPVYLAANGGVRPLPDLAAVLDGEVRVVLQGEVSTLRTGGKARLQNTFRVVPDAPVSRFVLTMRGGKNRGLLVNSTDLCRSRERGVAVFHGQNGRRSRTALRLTPSFKGCRKVRKQAARRTAKRKIARKIALRKAARH